MDKITVVVPCYNEEQSIRTFFCELKKETERVQAEFEVIFINDGSDDNTLKEIEFLANTNNNVYYVSFSRNFGKEAAIYAGMQYAKGDFVVLMDVDLQDPPCLIDDMYKELKKRKYDCVATRRTTRSKEPPIRSAFAHLFYKLFRKITSLDVIDGARDFRMMSSKMVKGILSLSEHNRFSKGIFSWVGFKTKWIEYENIERIAGITKWSFFKLLLYAIEGIVSFSFVPLYISGILGIVILLCSFLFAVIICVKGIYSFDVISMLLQLFLSGTMFVFLCILGMYLSKIFCESKKRPMYVLDKTNLSSNYTMEECIICKKKEIAEEYVKF